MLEIDRLSVAYNGIPAVQDVSLRLGPGQIVTVIGPNGAGKTTLLNAIMGVHPGQGRVTLRGADLGRLSVEARVRTGLCLVPEKRELFGTLTVEDNLRLGAFRFRNQSRASAIRALDEIFALFPRLHERRTQHAGTLSGGERQMLAMGRALMARPDVLMLDEPSLGLAPLIVRDIFRIITDLRTRGARYPPRRAKRPRRAESRRLRLCSRERQRHPRGDRGSTSHRSPHHPGVFGSGLNARRQEGRRAMSRRPLCTTY